MKNLFKKGLSVLFVAALVCTMASCGDKKETSSASEAASEVTSEATSEVVSEATSEAASEAVSEEASEAVSEEASEVVSEAVSEEASEATSEATDGEKAEFSNEYVSFNYPASFTKSENDGVIILMNEATGDNISIAVEDATDEYDTMTKEAFEAQLALTGLDVELQEFENEVLEIAEGTEVRAISYTFEYMGITMEQALLIGTAKGKTFCVTFTLVSENSDWAVETMLSLKLSK